MTHTTIETTVMAFRVGVNPNGIIKDTGVMITDYAKKFEQWTFDQQANRWTIAQEYFYFDIDHGLCSFPRYDLDNFCEFLKSKHVTFTIVERPPVEGEFVHFQMLPHVQFKNDKQKNAVEFLTNPDAFPLRGLALQTGVGKTVAYIMALQKIAARSITIMTSRLEQWVGEMQSYTTLDDEDIYTVKGVASLTKLFDQIDKQIKPKVILGSTQTLRRYLDYGDGYKHLPHPSELCETLKIGIVGTDEYHEHFYSNYMFNLVFNPKLFIPITATFLANDKFVKNIFDQFIPADKQFSGGAYDKFVHVTAYTYRSGGFFLRPFDYMGPKGYSQVKYETFLLKRGRKLFDAMIQDAILPIIQEHYIDVAEKGEKFLFLCSTTKLCDYLESVFRRSFPGKTVHVFYDGHSADVLTKYDMILSTPGSAGTGRDIKNLKTCFVFENTKSEIRNLQFIGRLRGPPSLKTTPEYVYLSLTSIPKHVEYANTRSALYGPRAAQFRHRRL